MTAFSRANSSFHPLWCSSLKGTAEGFGLEYRVASLAVHANTCNFLAATAGTCHIIA